MSTPRQHKQFIALHGMHLNCCCMRVVIQRSGILQRSLILQKKKITQTFKTCTNHSSATARSFATMRGKALQLDGRLAIAIKNFIYSTYATADMGHNCNCARRKKEGVELEQKELEKEVLYGILNTSGQLRKSSLRLQDWQLYHKGYDARLQINSVS